MDATKMTVAEALEKGIAFHKAGQLQDAERLYRAILSVQPNNPDANHNLGVIAVQVGKAEAGLPYFKAALEANQNYSQYWVSYINTLANTGAIALALFALTQAESKGLRGDIVSNLEEKLHSMQILQKKDSKPDQKINIKQVVVYNIIELLKQRCFERAETEGKKFIKKYKNDAFGYKVLGIILREAKKYTEAIETLKIAIALDKNDPEIFNSIGNVLRDTGQVEAAIIQYEKALLLNNNYSEVYNNLGAALQDLGRYEEAVQQYENALRLNQDFAEAYYNLGGVLRELRRYTESTLKYERFLQINPGSSDGYHAIGTNFKDLGQFEKAIYYFNKAIEINPTCIEAYNEMANALQDLGRYEESIQQYEKVLQIKMNYSGAYNNIGNALQRLGRYDEALEQYRIAIKFQPNYAEAYNNMGVLYKDLGDLDIAIGQFEKALEYKPDYVDVFVNLFDIKRYNIDSKKLSTLERIVTDRESSDQQKMNAHFALGKAFHKMNDFESSFIHFKNGHYFRSFINKSQGREYDHQKFMEKLAMFKQIFTRKFFEDRRDWGRPECSPFFVVGFPRSGTSLIEQILASHSSVFGAGELEDIYRYARSISQFDSSQQAMHEVGAVTVQNIKMLAAEYLRKTRLISGCSPYVVDKMPHNFESMWLIALLFPKATLIHCIREPEDTCFSCYCTTFTSGHEYVDDLRSLGRHYNYYRDMMNYWMTTLPIPIHAVKYESIVTSPDSEIKKMLESCGLNFEDSCIEFYKTKRVVKTASSSQVREKIYTSSIGNWKSYEKFLGPLLSELYKDRPCSFQDSHIAK